MLLLDEPTNDLDLDGLDRLERFVPGCGAPAVIVSHDREFLARTVNRIVELDLAQQQVGVYDGGYEAYLAEREVARRHAREAYEEYDDKLGALKDRAQTQRNWMAQGVRNARRKAQGQRQDRPQLPGRDQREAGREGPADRAAIERLEVVEEPRKEWELRMTIAAAPRSGTVVASLRGAVVRRGAFTLGPVDAQVDWADRVAITGRQRLGQDDAAAARCSAGSRSTRAPPGSGRACGSARSTRRAGCSSARSRWLRAFGDAVPGLGRGRRAHPAGQVRADAPTT